MQTELHSNVRAVRLRFPSAMSSLVPLTHYLRLAGFALVIWSINTYMFCYAQTTLEQTVNELIETETQTALKNRGKHKVLTDPDENKTFDPENGDKLFSIYGVNKNLTAELLIESKFLIFKSGRAQPVLGSRIGYELVKIDPPCVVLRRGESLKELCLEPVLP